MELIDDLNTEKWSTGDPNETTGFQNYRVMKCEKQETPGNFLYAVFNDEGFLKKVYLDGGAGCRDPLSGISLLQLRLSPDEKQIHGIIVEDDCVTVKQDEPETIISNGDDVMPEVDEEKEKRDADGPKEAEREAVDGTVNEEASIEKEITNETTDSNANADKEVNAEVQSQPDDPDVSTAEDAVTVDDDASCTTENPEEQAT